MIDTMRIPIIKSHNRLNTSYTALFTTWFPAIYIYEKIIIMYDNRLIIIYRRGGECVENKD